MRIRSGARWLWGHVASERAFVAATEAVALTGMSFHVWYAWDVGNGSWAFQCAAFMFVAYSFAAARVHRSSRDAHLAAGELIKALYEERTRLQVETALRDHVPSEVQ